jgi:hypothetical protein
MPLPVATEWYLIVNGYADRRPLHLDSVDENGNVQGTMSTSGNEDSAIPLDEAVWVEAEKQLTFKVTLENGEIQTYAGFLFDTAAYGVGTIEHGYPWWRYGLAGTFTGDRFEDPARPGFGWFALGIDRFT